MTAVAVPPALFDVDLPPAPYPGLRPFERHEWPIFFGREPMTRDVITRLLDQNLVVVHGDSGCGKSSLIRAGVLVQLEQQHERGGHDWRTCIMLPREAPLWGLAQALAGLRASEPPHDRVREIRRALNAGRGAAGKLDDLVCSQSADHVCILVDQFEELFRFAKETSADEARLFVEVLVGLLEEAEKRRRSESDLPPLRIYAILTMRSEFLGVCARFKGLAEAVNQTQYLLPQLERPALMRAIREPATLYDGEVSRELAERLMADAGGGQDQLPLIQHGLMLLWRRKALPSLGLLEEGSSYVHRPFELAEARMAFRYEDGPAWRLGLEDYEGGGLATLLSDHADQVMAKAASDTIQEKIVEHLFRALTDINAEGQAVRRPRTFAELVAVTGSDEQILRHMIDFFRADGVSFLRPYGNEAIEPKNEIDISHEALIRCWQRIADEKEGWLQREFRDGLIWKTLRMQAQRGEILSATATESRDTWLATLPSPRWTERYDGGWDDVERLMIASRRARNEEAKRRQEFEDVKRREAEERAQRAEEARRAAEALAAKQEELRVAQERLAEQAARRQEEERLRLENERLRLEEEQSRLLAEKSRLEQQALTARLEQQTRLAGERRRFTRLAAAAAVIAGVLATAAAMGFWQAQEAVIETKADTFWYRLQLWGDPLKPEDVKTLWDLAGADDQVRVAFVRQMTNDRQLLRRFGFKPQPIARAVGLRWPDEARQIAKQSLAYVASDQFDPSTADRFELIAYTRALAALQPWLDPALAEAATNKIADAINALAEEAQLSDRRLWALAETVAVFSERLDPAAIERARERLRREIMATAATGDAGQRTRAISRAIETMAPDLTPEERLQAIRYLAPRLGQDIDSWAAAAIPRALLALVPTLDASQTDLMLSAVPPAIARVAVALGDPDSSYLLALMRLAEALAGHEQLGAAFGQALLKQFTLPNDPLQHAALARATIPLLARLADGAEALVPTIAAVVLVPEGTSDDLDASLRSILRYKALEEGQAALEQALASLGGEPDEEHSESALQILHRVWSGQPVRSNPYLRAAQVRLLELLAPSLTTESAALASTDLLQMLPDARDYLTREAIARALAVLASTTLADANEREAALADAKAALATTGSTEEAMAWADAIAALLPAAPRAATAEIVEALKYPTAAGAPSDVLLVALATLWPDEHATIAGRTLSDPIVLYWLEAHLPDGHNLSDPPPSPPLFLSRVEPG